MTPETASLDLALLPPGWERASLPERYEAAKAALALCSRVDECRKWESWAYAAAAYARMAHDDSLERMAHQIRLRAVRRLGELIEAQKAAVGLNQGTRGQIAGRDSSGAYTLSGPEDSRPTLREAGISYRESSVAQRIASLPQEDFERAVEASPPPSLSALAEMARPSKRVAAVAPQPAATDEPDPFKVAALQGLEIAERLRTMAEHAPASKADGWGALVSELLASLKVTRRALAEASGSAVVHDIREGRRHG